MRNLYRSAVAVALLGIGSMGVATAAELNLTTAQKQAIVQSVLSEKGQPAPAGFLPKVGAAMPKSVSLQHLPASVAAQVPGAKELEYVKFASNEILLVEAKDRKVAGIIAPSGTTGAAPVATSPAPAAPSAPAAPK
jgi:hypothetical protein